MYINNTSSLLMLFKRISEETKVTTSVVQVQIKILKLKLCMSSEIRKLVKNNEVFMHNELHFFHM